MKRLLSTLASIVNVRISLVTLQAFASIALCLTSACGIYVYAGAVPVDAGEGGHVLPTILARLVGHYPTKVDPLSEVSQRCGFVREVGEIARRIEIQQSVLYRNAGHHVVLV